MTTKGGKRNGSGRPIGTPNKMTAEMRGFFTTFLTQNVDKFQILFDRVSSENPSKALDILLKISEFTVPKLRQVEFKEETPRDKEITPPIKWADEL